MTRPTLNLRLRPGDRDRWGEALHDGETLSDYLRAAADQLARQRAETNGGSAEPDVEQAVEVVVRHLAEHGHEALARAVAVVTDPDPPTQAEIAEIGRLALGLLRPAS